MRIFTEYNGPKYLKWENTQCKSNWNNVETLWYFQFQVLEFQFQFIYMVDCSKRYANPLDKYVHSWCAVLVNETSDLCDGNAKWEDLSEFSESQNGAVRINTNRKRHVFRDSKQYFVNSVSCIVSHSAFP